MNMQRLVFGAHLGVAAVMIAFGVVAAVSGQPIQLVVLTGMAVMIALLGRSAGRLAGRR